MYDDTEICDLILLAQSGDKGASDYLVEKNLGLVYSVVKKFYGRGHENDDLFQIGCMGLIKCVQKFDLSFGVKFSTYAVPMIIGEIKRFIRDDGIIKVSRNLKELSAKAMAVSEILQKQLNYEPSIKEIAAKLDVSPEDVAVALEACRNPESIYASNDDGNREGTSLADKLVCTENHEDEIIDRILIKDSLKCLGARERQIIILRYFKQKTQAQIAEMIGVSQVQVSRIEKKVLETLKENINSL